MLTRLALATLLLLTALPSRSESVWIGGVAGSGQTRVAYFGHVGPLPGKRLSDGWSQSLFVDRVTYEYQAGANRIQGRSSGLKLGVMRQIQLPLGSIGLGGGVAYQHTQLRPVDPGNDNQGGHVRAVTELHWMSRDDLPWKTQAFGQYVIGARSYYANVFAGRKLANGVAIGPQFATNGDPSYRIYSAALAVNGIKVGGGTLGPYVGMQHVQGGDTKPEIGVSFVLYRP